MARADARTFGLLNRWPVFMHEDFWRFNQILGQGVRLMPNNQNQPYIQYERQYIADALYDATDKAAEYLGYWPAPNWITDEIVTINSELHWSAQTLSTRFGHLAAFGKRATTLIAQDVSVTYSDSDSDTVNDLATLATVSGVQNIPADEIQVFFRQEDGAPNDAHEYWQIEPLIVTKTGDNAVIKGPRWLFVKPSVWAKEYVGGTFNKFNGDTSNAGDFVTQVDVSRVYADATNAVQLLLNAGQVGSANAVVNATAEISDAFMGHFTLHTADGQTAPTGAPTKVRVSYRAGYPLDIQGQMDKQFAQAITRYANSQMSQMPPLAERAIGVWNDDTRVKKDVAARDAWTPPPFGITEGGLFAWSVISARRIRLKARETMRDGK